MASCVLHLEFFPDPVQTSLCPGFPHQHHSHGRTWIQGEASLLFCFFLSKEQWVDRVQLLQLTKKRKKNTKSLLERHGSMNGALSEHYTSCQYYLKRDMYCDYCRIGEYVRRKIIYHCAACKLNFCFDWKRNHFRKWHSAACDHFCMYS